MTVSSPAGTGACVVYVDAGYLLAAAAQRLTGTALRTSVSVDFPVLIDGIIDAAEADSGRPMLRLYWYDAARQGAATAEHRAIGLLPRTKIRIGRIGISGEQKGVDLRLGLDIVSNAQRQVASVAYLVSGDDDLAEAVEDAQAFGPQVVLLGVPADHRLGVASTALNLALAADRIVAIDSGLLDRTVTPAAVASTPVPVVDRPVPAVPGPIAPRPGPGLARPAPNLVAARRPTGALVYSATSDAGVLLNTEADAEQVEAIADRLATAWYMAASPAQVELLMKDRPNLPSDVDRVLLQDASTTLGIYDLPQQTRFALRRQFWEALDRIVGLPARGTESRPADSPAAEAT